MALEPMAVRVAPAKAATPHGSKTLGWVFMIVTAVTMAYWMMWFMVPGGRAMLAVKPGDSGYLMFENAFPVADGWMALTALIAGIQLLRGKSDAIPWLFMGGSAGMYLGGMDVLYDLENKIYGLITSNPGSVTTELGINVATVVISLVSLVWAWRNRRWMCAG